MVQVSMSQPDCLDCDSKSLGFRCDFFGFPAGVKHDGFERLVVVDDRTVLLKFRDWDDKDLKHGSFAQNAGG